MALSVRHVQAFVVSRYPCVKQRLLLIPTLGPVLHRPGLASMSCPPPGTSSMSLGERYVDYRKLPLLL